MSEKVMTLSASAQAKLNITLKITDTRIDGYHNLLSLFVKLNLSDQISITKQCNITSTSCEVLYDTSLLKYAKLNNSISSYISDENIVLKAISKLNTYIANKQINSLSINQTNCTNNTNINTVNTATVNTATTNKIAISNAHNNASTYNDASLYMNRNIDINNVKNNVNNVNNVKIVIHKKIPICAGLGGGSSNAATVLKMMNYMFNLNLSHKELIDICKSVGADVPFFLIPDENKCALIGGIGDIIKPVQLNIELYLMLIKPDFNLVTSEVYRQYDILNQNKTMINRMDDDRIVMDPVTHLTQKMFESTSDIKILINNIKNNIVNNNGLLNQNDLYAAALTIEPKLAFIIDLIYSQKGCINASMTGSGSVCFGIFESDEACHFAINSLKKNYKNWLIFYDKINI